MDMWPNSAPDPRLFQSVAGISQSQAFAGLGLKLLETVLCKCMTGLFLLT